jgi:hypothetical protein
MADASRVEKAGAVPPSRLSIGTPLQLPEGGLSSGAPVVISVDTSAPTTAIPYGYRGVDTPNLIPAGLRPLRKHLRARSPDCLHASLPRALRRRTAYATTGLRLRQPQTPRPEEVKARNRRRGFLVASRVTGGARVRFYEDWSSRRSEPDAVAISGAATRPPPSHRLDQSAPTAAHLSSFEPTRPGRRPTPADKLAYDGEIARADDRRRVP